MLRGGGVEHLVTHSRPFSSAEANNNDGQDKEEDKDEISAREHLRRNFESDNSDIDFLGFKVVKDDDDSKEEVEEDKDNNEAEDNGEGERQWEEEA